jgi:UDP-N-acetylglucosamine:LPS N-acetylglucosamine transferase
MSKKNILFISGSIGLGHVNRDLAIADELSTLHAGINMSWLAGEPAKSVIIKSGGRIVPEIEQYGDDTGAALNVSKGSELNLYKYIVKTSNEWEKNVNVFKRIIQKGNIDLVIGDETYEILIAMLRKKLHLNIPFVVIYDFLGLDAMTPNPMELITVYMINRMWAQDHKVITRGNNMALFVGEPEDVQDKQFGVFLPNRRTHAKEYYKFIGYILPFKPEDYADIDQLRRRLGYGKETLVIVSIGGTGVGKTLLETCGKAYPIIKERFPDLRMIMVGGPGSATQNLSVPSGVEVKQYIPALYEHFAACDMAIVQAGGTTTLELSALRRPFIYVPAEKQCEQNLTVCGRLERHKAGIRMNYKDVTAESLAETVIANIRKKVNYESIPINGARQASELIGNRYLSYQ